MPVARPRERLERLPVVAPVVDDGAEGGPVALAVAPVAPAVAAILDEGGEGLNAFVAGIDVRGPRAAVLDGPPACLESHPHRAVALVVVGRLPAAVHLIPSQHTQGQSRADNTRGQS